MRTLSSTPLPSPGTATAALGQLLVKVLQRDTIPSLTFTDPWGTAVAGEAKKKETRSWPAPRNCWRCPLAIHISGTLTPQAKAVCDEEPFREVLERAGYSEDLRQRFSWNLPLRQIIAIAWLEGVERIQPGYPVDQQERYFGNYLPGRYAWNFGAVYRLKQPVVAVGRLGLWQWSPPDHFWNEIQAQADQLRLQISDT